MNTTLSNISPRTAEELITHGLDTEEKISIVRAVIQSITTQSNIILYEQGMFNKTTGQMDKIEILTRLSDGGRILAPFIFLPEVQKQ